MSNATAQATRDPSLSIDRLRDEIEVTLRSSIATLNIAADALCQHERDEVNDITEALEGVSVNLRRALTMVERE